MSMTANPLDHRPERLHRAAHHPDRRAGRGGVVRRHRTRAHLEVVRRRRPGRRRSRSHGTLTFPDYGAVPLRIEAIDAPRSISYRWGNDDALGHLAEEVDPEHSTVFTFTLEAVPDGTRLTVVETGFETTSDPAANLESHRDGWNSELDKLVALLEGDA